MEQSLPNAGPQPARRTLTLRFKLTASVVLTVLAVLGASLAFDYVTESRFHKGEVFAGLQEQADLIRIARTRYANEQDLARYVEAACERMNQFLSPGHHIVVLDPQGKVVAASRRHSPPEVEQALARAPDLPIVPFNGHRVAQVRLRAEDGSTIVVAQYLDLVEKMLREEVFTRVVTALVAAIAIIVLVSLALDRWLLRPVRGLDLAARAWSARDFAFRAPPSGPAELRRLTGEFNALAGELDRYERRRHAEMERAQAIQANLLPPVLPAVAGLRLVAEYRPMEEVAGDLYDVFALPNWGRTALLVLDVAGHGLSAALLTGVAKMSLHRRLTEQTDPAKAVALVNRDLEAYAPEGCFVTACVGVWDPAARTWTYAAAGHPGGLLLSGGDGAKPAVTTLPATGPLLAVLPEGTWVSRVVPLRPGDRLFLYTDGVFEAGAPSARLGEAGVAEILTEDGRVDLGVQVRRVMDEVVVRQSGRHGPADVEPDLPFGRGPGYQDDLDNPRSDDATMLALEVLPPLSTEAPHYQV